MPRQTKHDKALRILAERRLTVETIGDPMRPGLILATCRGESEAEFYSLGYRPDLKRWGCTCEASSKFHLICSHLYALKLVTVKTRVRPRVLEAVT